MLISADMAIKIETFWYTDVISEYMILVYTTRGT